MFCNLRLAQRLLISHIVIVLICFLSVGAYWIYQEYSQFKTESSQLRAAFTESQNNLVQAEVEKAAGYIEFTKIQLLDRLKSLLKERVELAHSIAEIIVRHPRSNTAVREIKAAIRDTLGELCFFEGSGYFFVSDGKNGFTRLKTNQAKADARAGSQHDEVGAALDRELRRIAAEGGQGYIRFSLNRDAKPGGGQAEIAYVKRFEPAGWIIGAGVNLDEWEKSAKEQIIAGLSSVIFNKEGYLFAGTYEGVSLLGPAKGKNMINQTDLDGKYIVRELIAAAKRGGGFVQYVMPDLGGNRQADKMSYVMGVPDWGWYVGGGYYMSEIETEIAGRQSELGRQIRNRIIFIVSFVLALSLAAVLISRILTRRLVQELDVFKRFFQQAAETDQPVALQSLNIPEFIELAQAANVMIHKRQKAKLEKEQIEDQLLQSQKMEAVGTLAGGVAHDFNNLLAIISGYTELAINNSVQGVSSSYELEQVQKAAMRGKDLVRQILTFSHHTEPDLKPMNINHVVSLTVKILERILPKMITIDVSIQPDVWPIMGDANQVEQVLLNLGGNAKDAMPEGGRLVIETMNLELGSDIVKTQPEAQPGKYVLLRVADNGVGMDEETQKHVFEPFFTTKEVGKGTGLGLSTVFGIVKAHGGHLSCNSQPGRGMEINIYWPAAPLSETETEYSTPLADMAKGNESIMIVDDEAGIRDVSQRIFSMAGYSVVVADSGEAALEIYRKRQKQVSLVILDLGMPGMGGYRCLEELKELDPDIKVVVASGYSQDREVHSALNRGAVAFVPKPYTAGEILRTVRAVLDNGQK